VELPPFDDRGVLPATDHGAPYRISAEDLERRFVAELGSASWRRRLMAGWKELAALVWDDCPGAYWWIWGGFVTNHPEPRFGDHESLTCAVFLQHAELTALPTIGWEPCCGAFSRRRAASESM
jgi:hypothetical protein